VLIWELGQFFEELVVRLANFLGNGRNELFKLFFLIHFFLY
jgi:hypothetical protein